MREGEREVEPVHPSPHTQQRSVSAGVRDRQRGEGVAEQSGAGRGGKRECTLVVSFAARLPPSALEKPECVAFACLHSETLVGIFKKAQANKSKF